MLENLIQDSSDIVRSSTAIIIPELIKIVSDSKSLKLVMDIWLKVFTDSSIDVIGSMI